MLIANILSSVKPSTVFLFVLSYPVVGDKEVTHCVALALLLPFYLNGDVPVDHCSITGPILSTLFLQKP